MPGYVQGFKTRKARRGDEAFMRRGASLEAIEAVASTEKGKKKFNFKKNY